MKLLKNSSNKENEGKLARSISSSPYRTTVTRDRSKSALRINNGDIALNKLVLLNNTQLKQENLLKNKSTNLSTESSSLTSDLQNSASASSFKQRTKTQETTILKRFLVQGIDKEDIDLLKSTSEKILESKLNSKGLQNVKHILRKTRWMDQCSNVSNFGADNEEELYYTNNIYSRQRAFSQPPSLLKSISMRTFGFTKQTLQEKLKQPELNKHQDLLLTKNINESQRSISANHSASSLFAFTRIENTPENSINRY